MKSVVLVTKDPELLADAREVCSARGLHIVVEADWQRAIDKAATANLMVVDLLATLSIPHRISGYINFAETKMRSAAAETPVVLIGAPDGYRLDGMAGWPGFLAAFIDRPITDHRLHYLLDYA
jgi:hypothetical protein